MKFSLVAFLGLALSVAAAPIDATAVEARADKSCSGVTGGLGCILGGIGSGDGLVLAAAPDSPISMNETDLSPAATEVLLGSLLSYHRTIGYSTILTAQQ